MRYWLMKSEPGCYSIDDLEQEKVACWDGVRNYQARNFMRDDMKVGDKIFFYHSNAKPTGIVGTAEVSRESYPDHTAQDPNEDHFDPKATPEKPIWMMVDIKFVEKYDRTVTLQELKDHPELDGLAVIKRGQRLSVQPVSEEHFQFIESLAK